MPPIFRIGSYENILQSFHCPLNTHDKRIFVLRRDFILATGIKNSGMEYGNKPLDAFEGDVRDKLNLDNRYGHPSLALPEHGYDGSVYLGGYIARRAEYLLVYLMSGRFSQDQLIPKVQKVLELYLAKKFIDAYGVNKIRFYNYVGDTLEGGKEARIEKARFFQNEEFSKAFREYDWDAIQSYIDSLDLAISLSESQDLSQPELKTVFIKEQWDSLFTLLLEKETKYKNKGKTTDSEAVRHLYQELNCLLQAFSAHCDRDAAKVFRVSCESAISNAEGVLGCHRGWSGYFKKLRDVVFAYSEVKENGHGEIDHLIEIANNLQLNGELRHFRLYKSE